MNYFEVFSLPRILNIDLRALEKSFHELSRKYHPDVHTMDALVDKQSALQMIALVNDAYRTLRHPIHRVEYLLEIEGFKADGSKVPKSFLMEVFEINERLDEFKSGDVTPEQAQELRAEIQRKHDEFTGRIEEATGEWDRLVTSQAPDAELKPQLSKMTEILSEFSYIRNLERDLEEKH